MRRHTSRALITVAIALASFAALMSPADAQNDPGEIASLEARRDELALEIGGLDAQIDTLSVEIDELTDEQSLALTTVELLADDIERTVFAREEPAATRMEIAIVGFTQGDPRQNEMLNEVRTLEGDDEPSRRRALYESVIRDAEDRLAVIDSRLVELDGDLTATRDELTDLADAITTADGERADLGTQRTALLQQLDDITTRIEELRALEARAVLTGTSTFDDPTRPALAVKIDNVRDARPQAGINQADIVFVEEVEGGLTRLAAVFHSQGSEVVGPVRSMRTGDFDLLAQLNGPLFSNSGGNRGAVGALPFSNLVDVGINAQSSLYYRDPERRAPHNLFTNAFNLWSVGATLEGTGTPSPFFVFRTPADPRPGGAVPINGVSINYGTSRVDYSWNGSGWDRSQDGDPTVDADGLRTSPTTVVVQFTEYATSPADPTSPEAVSIAQGDAWILTDGHLVNARWNRPDIAAQTDYLDPSSGVEIPILPGNTWIELPRPGRASTN